MDLIEKKLLKEIVDIEKTPMGAYNIRENGKGISRNTTANIDIVTKEDKPGIDIIPLLDENDFKWKKLSNDSFFGFYYLL